MRIAAQEQRVTGGVRNLEDGRVEIQVSGESDRIAALLSAVRQGPPGARVDSVENLAADPDSALDDFELRF